jgi:hypothetical protein
MGNLPTRRSFLQKGTSLVASGWVLPPSMTGSVHAYKGKEEIRQANAGYRYDPEILTDYPAVVLNRFGKGLVAYCAAYPHTTTSITSTT